MKYYIRPQLFLTLASDLIYLNKKQTQTMKKGITTIIASLLILTIAFAKQETAKPACCKDKTTAQCQKEHGKDCCKGKPAAECKHSDGKACAKSADGKACCKEGQKAQTSADAKPACCQGKPASECKHSEGKACAKSADGKACCKAGEHKEEPKK